MLRAHPRALAFLAGLLGLAAYALARSGDPAAFPSQVTVDEAIERLTKVGRSEVKGWRWQRGAGPESSDVGFDDAAWEKVDPGHQWSGENTEGWYRTVVTVPQRLGGFAVGETTVALALGVDDFGEIWVDGVKRTDFQWDQGQVDLAARSKPGDRFHVAVRARNRSGRGGLMFARLSLGAVADVETAAGEFADALRIGRRIATKLAGDEPSAREAVGRAVAALDLDSADRGERAPLLESIRRAREELSALRRLTEGYRIFCAGYSHIDLAWLWRWIETVQVCKETFASALSFMKEYPDFRFSMSQSHAYRWMEEREPELFRAIQQAVRDGKWEIVGGTAVELDCNLPDAESHVRQILHGQRYFEEKFGKRARIGWCPDSFGYNGNLPQILKKSGIDYFLTSKIAWNDTNEFPHNLFWWEAPDGSRVLTFLPLGGYCNELEGEPMIDHLKKVESQTGWREILMVYGVGNHGGGPTREMLERQERLAALDFYPRIEKTTALEYFEAIPAAAREKLPTWNSELYLEYHRGTYTTQAANKRANRKGEVGLVTAEKLATVAGLAGLPYPASELERAWDHLLFNQMHDILPGSSIGAVYRDSAEDYARMFAEIDRVNENALARLYEVAPQDHGNVLVFNPLTWKRDDVATLELGEHAAAAYEVRDPSGALVPSQVVGDEAGRRSLLFVARAMPPLGYRFYRVAPAAGPASSGTPPRETADAIVLENEALTARIDRRSGSVVSLVHKASGREALAGPANRIQILEDTPKVWDAWELGFTGKSWELERARSVEVLEAGPVRTTVRVRHGYLGDTKERRKPTEEFPSSFFVQDVSLAAGLPWLETRMSADWWEEHACAKVAFPLAVEAAQATYEIPYATIERSTRRETPFEKARYEVPAQKWADLSAGGFGVSLLNESKHGYDALGKVLRLTCFRAPTWPDPVADRGRHAFVYALFPHSGTWREAGTVRAAHQLNHPLVVFDGNRATSFATLWGGTSFAPFDALGVPRLDSLAGGAGASSRPRPAPPGIGLPGMKMASAVPLGAEGSFLETSAPNVVVPVVKRADRGEGWIVRLYESTGAPHTDVTLTFPFEVASAARVSLLEEDPQPLQPSGRSVALACGPYSIETLRVVPR